MVSNGQLNMFESDPSATVLLLPERLNYGIHERGMHRIPEVHGLYYCYGFLDEYGQSTLIECLDANPGTPRT